MTATRWVPVRPACSRSGTVAPTRGGAGVGVLLDGPPDPDPAPGVDVEPDTTDVPAPQPASSSVMPIPTAAGMRFMCPPWNLAPRSPGALTLPSEDGAQAQFVHRGNGIRRRA